MPRPFPERADRAELERRYRFEKQLADRLRAADAGRRAELYAEVYAEYARGVPLAGDDAGSLALQRGLLAPWLRPGAAVVEIGAGSGLVARSMLGEGRRVVAIEATAPGGPESAADGVEWLAHDRTETLATAGFDLAYSCHVLEHLHPDDLPGHFADVLRWLRPGAPYLFVTPNRLLGPHDVSAYFADRPEGLHLREYSHGDLYRLAKRAGFARVVAVDRRGRPSTPWPRLAAEALLGLAGPRVRRRLFDGLPAMRARMPLRPLEQVALATFAPP